MYIIEDYEKSFVSMEELVSEVNLENFTVNTTVPPDELPDED